MKVTFFGVGYVGLVQAAVFAEVGHHVVCVDTNKHKIKNLKKGIISIYEPGLELLIQKNCELNRLKFTTSIRDGVKHGIIQFITVNTPQNKDGSIDLKHVIIVVRKIAQYMYSHKVILNKSTVPVGTADKMYTIINKGLQERHKSKLTFDVISNPEFMKEGTAVNDCMYPDRIVLGIKNNKNIDLLHELYEPFNRNNYRIILMDLCSAELTKYAANCMLATKISLINEISNIAELLGVDIDKVRQGISSDSRIGHDFIYPGCGYGGSCFPKDIRSIIHIAEKTGYQPKLLQAVEHVNSLQKKKLLKLIYHHFGENINNKKFALWGVSFKPNTNDVREASSLILIESLLKLGAKIQIFDPQAMNSIKCIYNNCDNLYFMDTKEAALQNADALVICTEWQEFYTADFNIIKSMLQQPVIFDGRNIFDPEQLINRGFIYYGISRGLSIVPFNKKL